jgi:replication-associated recombination protein RarA
VFKEEDFVPKTTADLVFGNAQSKSLLDDLISGNYPFPAFGKCGILLWGTWGTGKTAAAKIIPDAMETAQFSTDSNWHFEPCVAGGNGPALLNRLDNQTQFVSFNASGRHYIVLDEVDNLTANAQLHLKSIMNRKDVVWIMTTNYITGIDQGVQNRCHLIEMNAADASAWLPLCRRVLASCGSAPLPDAVLLPIITAGKGSAREIINSVAQVAFDRARKQAT